MKYIKDNFENKLLIKNYKSLKSLTLLNNTTKYSVNSHYKNFINIKNVKNVNNNNNNNNDNTNLKFNSNIYGLKYFNKQKIFLRVSFLRKYLFLSSIILTSFLVYNKSKLKDRNSLIKNPFLSCNNNNNNNNNNDKLYSTKIEDLISNIIILVLENEYTSIIAKKQIINLLSDNEINKKLSNLACNTLSYVLKNKDINNEINELVLNIIRSKEFELEVINMIKSISCNIYVENLLSEFLKNVFIREDIYKSLITIFEKTIKYIINKNETHIAFANFLSNVWANPKLRWKIVKKTINFNKKAYQTKDFENNKETKKDELVQNTPLKITYNDNVDNSNEYYVDYGDNYDNNYNRTLDKDNDIDIFKIINDNTNNLDIKNKLTQIKDINNFRTILDIYMDYRLNDLFLFNNNDDNDLDNSHNYIDFSDYDKEKKVYFCNYKFKHLNKN